MPAHADADGQDVSDVTHNRDALGVLKVPVIFYPITDMPTEASEDLVRFLFAETRAGSLYCANRVSQEFIGESDFVEYWFAGFTCVAIIDEHVGGKGAWEERNWKRKCIGTFSIKPNYSGKKPVSMQINMNHY
jgi:hypothetical protein